MTQQRRDYILDVLNSDKKIRTSDIVKHFNVTMETVRRDLKQLEDEGLLRRIYGGAIPGRIYEPEPSYDSRQITRLNEKISIAKKTIELLDINDTVFLDGGTTLLQVAKEIVKSKLNLTIITPAISIAEEVIKNKNCQVILLGGIVQGGETLVTGFLCNDNIQMFRAQKCIIGAAGITKKGGVTDYNMEVSFTKRKMISQSDNCIVASDSSKFGKEAMFQVSALIDVNAIVTDNKISDKDRFMCTDNGIDVILADCNNDN